MEEAASLPEAAFTVWANLFAVSPTSAGRLFAGESFLMQGGTSGVGIMAIQAARAFGARVASTAGSAEKCAFLRELGCERAFNYREEDWVAGVRAWATSGAGGPGVDVILDMVGGDYFAKHLELLARDGRLIHIATLQGADVPLDLRKTMAKRLTITGSTLRSRPVEEKRRLRDRWRSICGRRSHRDESGPSWTALIPWKRLLRRIGGWSRAAISGRLFCGSVDDRRSEKMKHICA
jgi:NADPH2:quinone reductase